eukprot:TRINITY_DN13597_c0_g4_i1.p3 TRINITY_DN13597_c0_g4~~TRINITY_DN13597_c0_g4_i1.p3  ORF type:complete len:199 (-),score=-10.07 TRINITY_DN13597_c0_g4_i1:885-1481(-)
MPLWGKLRKCCQFLYHLQYILYKDKVISVFDQYRPHRYCDVFFCIVFCTKLVISKKFTEQTCLLIKRRDISALYTQQKTFCTTFSELFLFLEFLQKQQNGFNKSLILVRDCLSAGRCVTSLLSINQIRKQLQQQSKRHGNHLFRSLFIFCIELFRKSFAFLDINVFQIQSFLSVPVNFLTSSRIQVSNFFFEFTKQRI